VIEKPDLNNIKYYRKHGKVVPLWYRDTECTTKSMVM